MIDTLRLTQADVLNGGELLITFSDGRSILMTLEQVLAADSTPLPDLADDDFA